RVRPGRLDRARHGQSLGRQPAAPGLPALIDGPANGGAGMFPDDRDGGVRIACEGDLDLPASVVTLGAFDGVHRGHQALISAAIRSARALRLPAVVWTFDPLPKVLFAKARPLTPRGERLARIAALGPDWIIVSRFTPSYAARSAERFLASLALALGLADIAAESGGRLECLFLDEGFSALDAESLEQAMEGVERLAGDGRLVGVITHLPGVVERLGAAIHIRKGPDGVSRVAPAAGIAAARPARGNPHRSATRAAADIRLR
ncbi:MAG: SbcC/MukB-like Walker B domain-containing protein, partial [Miltoncostaeaceae bacterium]